MSLSKPIYNFLGFYFEQLFNHPIRTKVITSSIIASSGALASQQLSGANVNFNTIFAYGAFGGLISGPLAHFFYSFLERIVPDVKGKRILEFLLERSIFAPLLCALSLFFLTLFEGKSHEEAIKNLRLFRIVLTANWRYLSLPVFLNFVYVPPLLRVFVGNLIGFFWVIFVADKRRRAAAKKEK